MKNLLIVGAGGLGREMLGWVHKLNAAGKEWQIGGFLDGKPDALAGFACPYGVVGDPATYVPQTNDIFLCAIGHPATKLALCRALQERGARFPVFAHPNSLLPDGNEIGEGCTFAPFTSISVNVRFGDFVAINAFSDVGHDSSLGDGCTLSSHCDVTGGVTLGEGVFLGSHAAILPRVTVGDYAIIGAGSVVLRKVKAGITVMGVPARQVAGF